MEFTRDLEIERGTVDLDTGRFPMVLASEAEASDGHILGIAGLDVPARMPMLFGHASTPDIPALGSIIDPTKSMADGVAVLRTVGVFNLTGDDPLAGVRRGIAQLVADGDLNAVSIRWTGEGTPRIELPKEHPHHIDRKADNPARWGTFFTSSRALEGSIVAIGADPRALVGRADAAEDGLTRAFFRMLSQHPEPCDAEGFAAAFAAVSSARKALDEIGATGSDLLRLLQADPDEELCRVSIGEGERVLLPVLVYERLMGEAQKMTREAFDLATSQRADVPEVAPEGAAIVSESDAPCVGDEDTPQGVVAVSEPIASGGNGLTVRHVTPGSVNAMGTREFAGLLTRVLSETVYEKTGRKKA